MKKRFLSALLCLCMVMCLMPTVSFATETASGTCGKDGSNNVTWTLDEDGTLTIGGIGDMGDYNYKVDPPWTKWRVDITNVVVENGITSIGDHAFYCCTNVKNVTLPDSVTSIGDRAFLKCYQLENVTIPNSVTKIGSNAFGDCDTITSIEIPDKVEKINSYTFKDCDSLKSVRISKGVKTIGDDAFSGCVALKQLIVDENNTEYSSKENVLFNKAGTILLLYPAGREGDYIVPDSVTTIPSRAFYKCNSLVSLTIPENVAQIYNDAIAYCDAIKAINVSENNSVYSSKDGVLFDKDATTLIRFPNKKAEEYEIPQGVVNIAANAFSGCENVKDVKIPNTVTEIESSAFALCSGLKSITIPDNVIRIGSSAFQMCSSLESVTLPDSLTSISNIMFAECTSLKSVNVPNGVTKIGAQAFQFCNSLESVTIPESVIEIDNSAFYTCQNLKKLTIPKSVITIGSGAFGISKWGAVDDFKATVEHNSAAEEYCKDHQLQYDYQHSFTNKPSDTVAKEANCTEAARYYVQCDYCDVISDQATIAVGDPKGHSFTTKASDKLAAEATCTEAAKYYVQCDNCDAVSEDKTVSVGNPEGHSFNEKASGKIAAEATCTKAAEYYVQCDNCDAVIEDKTVSVGNPKGHSFTNYVYNNDAKPGVDGTETAKCDRCDATETRTASGTAKPVISFTDVSSDQYYAEAVQWAVANGITNGMGDNKFEPDTTCTRGQIVTFLWRAKGKPEPSSNYNPFADVSSNAYYYKAVLWAVEKGITTGTSATTFSPDAGCTRAQVATFLWRAEGRPSSSASNPFRDVNTSEYYGTAVLWAVEKGITNGTSATEFSPNAVCTRGQIVTFLYRDMK